MLIDYSLYLVTDRGLALGRDTGNIVWARADGGAVVSAIVAATYPRKAVDALKQQIQSARDEEESSWNSK